jgi:hypothetical protein
VCRALTAFDLDIDADRLPKELAWLSGGRFQSSRQGVGVRGHYVFHTGTEIFVSGDIKLADGTVVGDVRSGNTVIMAEPSPHPKAASGGGYIWRAADVGQPFPVLPDAARPYLRPLGTAGSRGGVTATDDAVTQALDDWVGNDRPRPLDNLTGMVAGIRSRTGTRNTARNALRIAGCESRLGFYPLADAVAQIRAATMDSYTARGESFTVHIGAYEFGRLVANGVGWAMSRTLADIDAEANRRYGTNHRDSSAAIRVRFWPTYPPAFRSSFPSAFAPSFAKGL